MPLSAAAKKEFRLELTSFCRTAEGNERIWHYSQRRPYSGLGVNPALSHVDDCSAYCALATFYAGRHSGHPIADPLGMHYSGWGWTGSAYQWLHEKGRKIDDDDKFYVGDVAIYGPASRTVHMMICRRNGVNGTATWSSFGREAGPEPHTDVHYHPSGLLGVYRHPALQ